MGNVRIEDSLAVHMPENFREKCPVCKSYWTLTKRLIHVRFAKIAVGCESKNKCFSFCQTIGYSPNDIERAYRWLWRSYVSSVGLKFAIKSCEIDTDALN